MTKPKKLYPVATNIIMPAAREMSAVQKKFPGARYQDVRVKPIGEFRPPRKGEWYLSGAKPEGYVALNDLSTSYHIGELVRIRTVEVEV